MEKILAGLLVVVLICFGGFVFVKDRQMATMQTDISNSLVAQKALADNIMRASSQYSTKADLDAFAQQQNVNLAAIQKDLATLNAQVSGINVITVNSQAQNQTNVPSTTTKPNPSPPTQTVNCNGTQIPCPSDDPNGYTKNIQTLALNEDFARVKIPVGTVSFDASQPKPWSENIYGRTYDVVNVLGTDTNGKQYVYNKFSITSNGTTTAVPISTSKLEQQVPTASFSWWNPRLMLSMNGAVDLSVAPLKGEATPSLGLQVMSYGSTKQSPSISVLGVGVGYEIVAQRPAVVLNPISFNIGKVLPSGLIDNTYIGPSVQVDTKGNVSVGAGLSVGF